jgi:heme A synthase
VDTLHVLIARAMVLYYLLLGLWGLFLAVRRGEFDSAYRGALLIGLGLGIVQVLAGLVLVVLGTRPRDDLHYLYGLSVIVTLPLVHQYLARRRLSAPLAYGLASLFMMGLSLRGITTGG